MSMDTPTLPVDTAYIVVKRKEPSRSVEYVVYVCNAHGIIKSHTFSILLG